MPAAGILEAASRVVEREYRRMTRRRAGMVLSVYVYVAAFWYVATLVAIRLIVGHW